MRARPTFNHLRLSISLTVLAYSPTTIGGWLREEMAWPISYINRDVYI